MKRWLILLVLGCCGMVVYLWVRLPILTPAMSFHGLNSDYVINILMAKDIFLGRYFPIFFYGQNYLGPFCPLVTAGVQWILNIFGFEQLIPGVGAAYQVSPWAATLSSLLITWSGICLLSWGIWRQYSGLVASVFFFLAVVGGQEITMITVRNIRCFVLAFLREKTP